MKFARQSVLLWLIIIFVILLIYHPWFNNRMIARGDWRAMSTSRMTDYLGPPSIWSRTFNGGFNTLTGGWITSYPYFSAQAIIHELTGLEFNWTERILWFFPFIIFSATSMYLLSRRLFDHELTTFFSTLYFITNNFILFRLHGAQIQLATVYALTPLSLYLFIRSIEDNLWFAMPNAIILSLAAYNDLRLTILIIALQTTYGIYKSFLIDPHTRKSLIASGSALMLAGMAFILLNSFWILPTAKSMESAIPREIASSTQKTIKNLSRTDFLNTLALSIGADSRWNRFIYLDGQLVEIAIIPIIILTYGFSLFARPRRETLFWIVSAAVFAFLAKGLNPPLGAINNILYEKIPLWTMFRLPTKFLMVGGTAIALSFGLGCAGLISRFKKREERAVAIAGLIILPLVVIYPAFWGEKTLRNTPGGSSFKPFVHPIYFKFEKWIDQRNDQYKSIFLPLGTPRYVFFSDKHPSYNGINSYSPIDSYFIYRFSTVKGLRSDEDKTIVKILRILGVKYIFLAPPDDDSTWAWYSTNTYKLIKKAVLNIKSAQETENPYIFTLPDPLPHFFVNQTLINLRGGLEKGINLLSENGVKLHNVTLVSKKIDGSFSIEEIPEIPTRSELTSVSEEKLGASHYKLIVNNAPQGRFYLNFQERFDPNWVIDNDIFAQPTAAGTNYFVIDNKEGKKEIRLVLSHELQKYVDRGWKISILTWLAVITLTGFISLPKLKPGGSK